MTRLAVRARNVVTPQGMRDAATVVVLDGTIEDIVAGHPAMPGHQIVGDGETIVTPGLIDLHTHGAVGVQAIDGNVEDLTTLAAFYASHGVTGFLGTIGGSRDHIELGLSGLVELIERGAAVRGARCLGIHVEGPFISTCCPGAFRPDSIVPPDLATFQHYLSGARGHLSIMTVAPEVEGQPDVIRAARSAGVVCSAGHSAASEDQMHDAIGLGVTSLTHMFNAMPALHHRQPGIVGVGLTDDRLTAELIADGVHVHPTVVKLTARAKRWTGIALITDSIAAAGLSDGTYEFEEQRIVVVDGQARLHDGTLAGSTLTLDVAVQNFAHFTGLPWSVAVGSASAVPARVLGLDHRKGSIALGFDADMVGFDHDHDVCWTMVAGDLVYERASA